MAMQFLSEIEPDALINTFAVNVKNDDGTINENIDIANALQTDMFRELSGHVGFPMKRIPMFLTTSDFNVKKYGKALDNFKERLGVCFLCFHHYFKVCCFVHKCKRKLLISK